MSMPRLIAALIVLAPTLAAAQSRLSPRPSRVDQIGQVQTMLADPDPAVRLVNLETIVNAGDPVLINVALRTAFSGDDRQLRSLAMRAYLARYKEVVLDIALPADLVAQVEEARPDPRATQRLMRSAPYVFRVQQAGGKLRLVVMSYVFPEDRGKLEGRSPIPFSIVGERFSAFVPFSNLSGCAIEFSPTDKLTFEGALACPHGWPKLNVSAALQ